MKKTVPLCLLTVLVLTISSSSAANAAVHIIITDQGKREWTVDNYSILAVTTTTTGGVAINSNGLNPNSLQLSIDGTPLSTGLDCCGSFTSNFLSITNIVTEEGVTTSSAYVFRDNWVSVEFTSTINASINIESNLGSDSNTIFTTIGDKLFSYEKNGNNMGLGPIFQWETNGELTNTTDIVQINKTGTSLDLKLYVYAHDITSNLLVNRDDYLQQFALFAAENINRTDTFIYVAPAPAPAPAPVAASIRRSTNLTFKESLYASDTLSDPDGQLRATVDQIMNKYGSLVK